MWPPPRSSRRWPSLVLSVAVVQAGGYNGRHGNPCIACWDSPGWSSHRSAPQHASLSERRQSCERAIVSIVVTALQSLVVFLLYLNSPLLYHVCDFLEVVGDVVGSCLHQAFARPVAIGYAYGVASCVAAHEDVEMGVAHHHGVGGLQREVGERLVDGLGVGLGERYVLGGNHIADDVVEVERVDKLAYRLVAATGGYGEQQAAGVELAKGGRHMGEHGYAELAVDVLEDAAVAIGARLGHGRRHGLQHGERLEEGQADGGRYLGVGVGRKVHGAEGAVERVDDDGLGVGQGAVEIEDDNLFHVG